MLDEETMNKLIAKAALDPEFRKVVMEIMDDEVIMKFDQRIGEASDFYEENEEKGE